MRKSDGDKARLCFGANAVTENRSGLCVLLQVRNAVGKPESAVAVDGVLELRDRGFTPKTVGADRGYLAVDSVDPPGKHAAELRAKSVIRVTPGNS